MRILLILFFSILGFFGKGVIAKKCDPIELTEANYDKRITPDGNFKLFYNI
jgi:hypothetical protein